MSLYKRNGTYWSYIWLEGKRHSKSTCTGNRRKAEEMDRRFKEELSESRFHIHPFQPEMTFGTLAASFLHDGEVKAYHVDRLKLLLPYFGEIPIGQINKTSVREYRKWRHKYKTISDTTINRDLEALRRILNFAVDEGILPQNPLGRLKLVRERRKPRLVMSVGEELKLLQFAAPHLQRIIIAALDTGMRRGEILNQRWEHVEFSRRLLFVTKSKTAEGESREIPLTSKLFNLLWESRKEKGLIFMLNDKPLHKIKTAWMAAIRRAGIRYYRFHDLRHCFNTRLMEAGVQQEIRKALMGHSTGEDVNAIYTHVELPAKREAIRKLEDWVQSQVLKTIAGGDDDEAASESGLKSHSERVLPGS